ncbi:hypothetical protein [Klebsiella aerogenes]|uniref:hypothetical protein n=1 Tax=Klebsiella aerogenes TaxID=548 RepID=UPI00351D47E2
MMKVTKEWLELTIAEYEAICIDLPFDLNEEARNMLVVLKIALSQIGGEPFMYGIADPNGKAYIDEDCVSDDPVMVEITVDALNEVFGDKFYRMVPLYLGPNVPADPSEEKNNV